MPAPSRAEQGFVLVGAVWLLLLATALVAVLMLRASSVAKSVSQDGVDLQRSLDLDAATESPIAEMLIEGRRARWWMLPANGSVAIGDRSVAVSITSEEGRLDLNDADPKVIDGALQGLGYSNADRQRFLAALAVRRQAGRIGSTADVNALAVLLPVTGGQGACAADMFTIDSGLAQPNPNKASAALQRALAAPAAPGGTFASAGEAIRVIARAQSGRALATVVRLAAGGAAGLSITRRWILDGC